MLSYLAKRSNYGVFQFLNSLKFYLQKLPIIRKIWKDDSFAMTGLKGLISAVWPVAGIIIRMINKFIYFGFVTGISITLANMINSWETSIVVNHSQVFLWGYAYFGLFNLMKYFVDQDSLIFYDLLKVPARRIGISEIFIGNIIDMACMTLMFFFFNGMFKFDIGMIIKIQIMYLAMRFVANAINSYLENAGLKKGKTQTYFSFFTILLIIGMIAKDFIFKISPLDFLGNPILFGIILVLAIMSIYYLLNKVNYELVLSNALGRFENVDFSVDTKAIIEKSSELKEEDYQTSVSKVDRRLEGYPMLNELFFQRHRRLIFKPIKVKATIATILCLAILLAMLIWGKPDDYEEVIGVIPSLLPLLTYFLFYNETITRTMFVNCDEAFLQYDFYNRPKDLLEMFTLRLKKLLLWNSPGLVTLLLFFLANALFFEADPKQIAIIAVLSISLWTFFTVHTLFVYYIFQPYNDKYETKHPAYTAINIVIYLIAFMMVQITPSGPLVAPISIGITIIYTLIALSLVYRISPRTFVLRMRK